jgi:LacI family transcriptional regulator
MAKPSMADLARATGYSKSTISLALRGDPQIPAKTREKIQQAARKEGYQPNAIIAHLMAQLRAGRPAGFRANLALVNANRDRDAFRSHPTIPTYVAGCEQRAASLGYSVDRFWLHDPAMNLASWRRILTSRGIKGLILTGLMDTNRLPAALAPLWAEFPAVVTGVRTRDPALSFCCVDHHHLALTAVEQVLSLGYRRPALVLDDVIDDLVERRFSAGYVTAQRVLPRTQRLPIYGGEAKSESPPLAFLKWLGQHRPDVILTLYNNVLHWLHAAGKKVPRDLGVVQLEWRESRPEIAGMNQHNFVTGQAAVDMVVSQIHNGETGLQEFPRATLIGPTWMEGKSVVRQ